MFKLTIMLLLLFVIINCFASPPEFISDTSLFAYTCIESEHFIIAHDHDDDSLYFITDNIPLWLNYYDLHNDTLLFSNSFCCDHNQYIGEHFFSVGVSDGIDTVFQEFKFTMRSEGSPPIFLEEPLTEVNVGEKYNYYLIVTGDCCDDSVYFEGINLPVWLNIEQHNRSIALLTGVPQKEDINEFEIYIRAVNIDCKWSLSKYFKLKVKEPVFEDYGLLGLNRVYNYIVDTVNFITANIWVDSINVNNYDTIFYLNRIFLPQEDGRWALDNQPQFLLKQITKKINGDYIFEYPGSFILKTNANIDEEWVLDTANNITAIIKRIYYDKIFNYDDEFKSISLSTGDSIIISKNLGIVFFPDLKGSKFNYNLAGIEGLNIGEKVPAFWEFFDFNVGDIFQRFYGSISYGDGIYFEDYTFKYEIISKNILYDTLIYDVNGILLKERTINPFTDSFSRKAQRVQQQIKYSKSDFSLTQYYNFQKANLDIIMSELHSFEFGREYEYLNSFCRIIKTENNNIQKRFGANVDEMGNILYPLHCYFEMDKNTDSLWAFDEILFTLSFEEGLGMKEYHLWDFESTEYNYLQGYIKNGDTVGIIYSDGKLSPSLDYVFVRVFRHAQIRRALTIIGRLCRACRMK